ncbi:GNAT family N-acetyltransferase [Halocatena pleomorpha]|uniref:GNAT family N-acetyltransferase n=1 Tax=Halocatena pleomorpha TaxID=1785090 RepID=A0A3P3RLI8_9EURY|nr:GNAT family N-acetyltransferase [Halocatena pleomorpha]RRJ33720.1 GNAT family N-acetyltransferase [Halocatena pleomorpha]
MDVTQIAIRPARPDDYEAVAAFTRNTWPDREGTDYLPQVYHDWIEGGGDRKRTLVADAGDEIAGICQVVMLSSHEAWAQGMRVNPTYRGEGISTDLNAALFEWARDRGATVCRNMVFSWNVAGLGGSRAVGFEPVTEFRWAQPDPASDLGESELAVSHDPTIAWRYWVDSTAREQLAGVTLDRVESWALSELTLSDLEQAAEETAVVAVLSDGVCAMTFRTDVRTTETDAGQTETVAEYGVGAWDDINAAQALFRAIKADAADVGADRTRVLVPETPRHVSDVAWLRAGVSDHPDFVLAADLTDR